MLRGRSDLRLPEKPIKVEQDNKPSREILVRPNSSVEVYYGGGGASVGVPFMWESQPGTPKVEFEFRENPLPPLTPPPSFHVNSTTTTKPIKKHSKPNLLHSFLPRLNLRRKTSSHPASPASSSSSCSSSSRLVPRSPFDSRIDGEEECGGSPVSTLCFGIGRGGGTNAAGSRGCSSNMIKVLLREFS